MGRINATTGKLLVDALGAAVVAFCAWSVPRTLIRHFDRLYFSGMVLSGALLMFVLFSTRRAVRPLATAAKHSTSDTAKKSARQVLASCVFSPSFPLPLVSRYRDSCGILPTSWGPWVWFFGPESRVLQFSASAAMRTVLRTQCQARSLLTGSRRRGVVPLILRSRCLSLSARDGWQRLPRASSCSAFRQKSPRLSFSRKWMSGTWIRL